MNYSGIDNIRYILEVYHYGKAGVISIIKKEKDISIYHIVSRKVNVCECGFLLV